MDQGWPLRLNSSGHACLTPILAVRLDQLRSAAQELSTKCRSAGASWRPWICHPVLPDVLVTLRASGAVGFSCGTIDVTESLRAAGDGPVTLTRPPVGGAGPARLAQLARRTDVAVICEHFAQIEPIAFACKAAGSHVQLLLNVDSGRHRLGIRPGPDLSDLLEGLRTLPNVSVLGLALEPAIAADSGVSGSMTEQPLTHLLHAAQRSFARAGLAVKVVSLAQLSGLGELGGVAVESRSALPQQKEGPYSILSTVIGRPTRDIAVIDAGAMHLNGFRSGDVVSAESHFKEIRSDCSVLFVCGTAQDLLVGDLVAIPVTTPCFPWATSVLLGEGGDWRVGDIRLR